MSNNQALEQIIELAESVAKPQGLLLVDVRFSQQGNQRTLEVTLHRPGGQISLSDCESFSRQLEILLDDPQHEPVTGPFLLEVQSPGIDRQLKTQREFEVFNGYTVEVKTKEDLWGLGYTILGELLEKTEDKLVLGQPRALAAAKVSKSNPKTLTSVQTAVPNKLQIDLRKITHVRLHPVF